MSRRNRHYKKRRRTGSLSFLYKLLCFVAICGAIAVAMALFFKADSIRVEGNSTYSAEQVIDASGIHAGDNLYLLNKYDAADRIIHALPYVEQVQIKRQLPDTLVITVSECTAPAAISQDGKLWLISGNGKVVGNAGVNQADRYTLITGVSIVSPEVGYSVESAGDSQNECAAMLRLLGLMEERDMLQDVGSIHLESHDAITMSYLERFEVILPWDADWEYKLDYLLAVVDRLEANETGTIDMMQDGTASFIPKAKTALKSSPSDISEPGNTPQSSPVA